MTLSQTPESDEEGDTSSPFSSIPSSLETKIKSPRSPSELVPHFLDQSYAPDCLTMKHLLSHYFHVVENKLVCNAV